MNTQCHKDQRRSIATSDTSQSSSSSSSSSCSGGVDDNSASSSAALLPSAAAAAAAASDQIHQRLAQHRHSTSKLRVNEERIQIGNHEASLPKRHHRFSGHYCNISTKKVLTFNPEVNVYEFNTIIGDNPGVSNGCPVALDAKLSNETTLCLWDLERRSAARTREDLKLCAMERSQRLHNAGFSTNDIAKATMTTLKHKEKRSETNRRQKWDNVNFFVEFTGRGLKKIILGSNDKKKRNRIHQGRNSAAEDRQRLRLSPTASSA